jgi:hypothetical protein
VVFQNSPTHDSCKSSEKEKQKDIIQVLKVNRKRRNSSMDRGGVGEGQGKELRSPI